MSLISEYWNCQINALEWSFTFYKGNVNIMYFYNGPVWVGSSMKLDEKAGRMIALGIETSK